MRRIEIPYTEYLNRVYSDGMAQQVDEWAGIKEGDRFTGYIVQSVFIHPESGCAWCVLARNKDQVLFERDLPYEKWCRSEYIEYMGEPAPRRE